MFLLWSPFSVFPLFPCLAFVLLSLQSPFPSLSSLVDWMAKKDFVNRDGDDAGDSVPEGSKSEGTSGVIERERSSPSSTSSSFDNEDKNLTERLRSVLMNDARGGDDGNNADLILERDDVESGIVRWLRALDLHVLGACRGDERLKPLLKLNNVSGGNGDDRLMSQLCQHFEASEVGMLVRCLCIPLVSIRVGKVRKQGNILSPTNIRGHLNLTLLPSSDLQILFCGDDGCKERIAIVPLTSENFGVTIEELSADNSGRSFSVKQSGDQVSYFWCSEKSKLCGAELLEKMKHLLQRKPSLSQLTGICETRLDSFATHLRAYLLVATSSTEITSVVSSNADVDTELSNMSSSPNTRSLSRLNTSQSGKSHPIYQGSLSPRSSTFKDVPSRNLSSLKTGIKQKFRRRGDDNTGLLSITSLSVTTSLSNVQPSSSRHLNEDVLKGDNATGCSFPALSCLTSYPSSLSPLPFHFPLPELSASSSTIFSPCYCWCPPCSSSFQHIAVPSIFSPVATESFSLPPLSSLLSEAGPLPFLPSEPSLEQSLIPALDLPSIFPAASYVAMPSSHIPTFTPFMSDPIVHIPVIDVCTSGPGCLVSAGPAISSAIPLLPNLVRPLTEAESLVEKSARETLRMLMASAPISPQLMQVFPAVLTSVSDNFPCVTWRKQGMMVTGSRGLYTGAKDVDAIANGIGLIGFTTSSSTEAGSGGYVSGSEKNGKDWNGEKNQKNETESSQHEETEV